MVKVFSAICLEGFCPAPDEDATFVLRRGREYTVSREVDGRRRVFARYWVWVPAHLFAGVNPLGEH
jgi:hypothetical protein